jgi:hypothetical protein
MVMHHEPFPLTILKDICGQHPASLNCLVHFYLNILRTDYPGYRTMDSEVQLGHGKLHGEGMIKNPHPTVPDCTPTGEPFPSGMDTLNPFVLRPDLVHQFDIELLKGLIKTPIDQENISV